MTNRSAIQEELKELNSSLADVSYVLPYSIPDDYFTIFEQRVALAIKAENRNEAPATINELPKEMPFSLPQGYFEQLTGNIVANASVKGALTKEMPFALPKNYFETFPVNVLQAVQNEKKTTTQIPSRFVFRHIRLAAAAVLLLCIGMGAYTTIFNTSYKSPELMLRSVSKSEIEAYLENADKAEALEVTAGNLSFDSKDIVVYLNETGWE